MPTNTLGFTFIELLVVIAIIALLVGILLPSIRGRVQRFQNRRLRPLTIVGAEALSGSTPSIEPSTPENGLSIDVATLVQGKISPEGDSPLDYFYLPSVDDLSRLEAVPNPAGQRAVSPVRQAPVFVGQFVMFQFGPRESETRSSRGARFVIVGLPGTKFSAARAGSGKVVADRLWKRLR